MHLVDVSLSLQISRFVDTRYDGVRGELIVIFRVALPLLRYTGSLVHHIAHEMHQKTFE